MNYRYLKAAGRTLYGAQAHRLNAAFSPRDYVRVTYTHQVLKENEQNFGSLVDFLASSCTVLTPPDFFRMFQGSPTPQGRNVLLTFDDGLRSSYSAIKRFLSSRGIKTIMFIPTQILELRTKEDMKRFAWRQLNFQQGDPPKDFREEEFLTMSKEEILDLHKEGHAVFPHTHSHKRLHEINDEPTAVEELARPKKILEELLQHPMNAFAFPVGTERVVSPIAFSYVRREYQYCFTALAGKNTSLSDPYFLRRDCMNADYDQEHVRNMQEGVFDLFYDWKLRQLQQRASRAETKSVL